MSLDLQAALVQAYAERLSLQPNPPQPQERSYAAQLSVGAADVLLPPHNRWTFQHMSQLCPTLVVVAGNAPVSDLGPTEDLLQDFTFTSLSGEQVSLQEHLDATFTDGFLVLKKGRILCERYFNHQAPDTRHIMFSVTKSLTGAWPSNSSSRACSTRTAPRFRTCPNLPAPPSRRRACAR